MKLKRWVGPTDSLGQQETLKHSGRWQGGWGRGVMGRGMMKLLLSRPKCSQWTREWKMDGSEEYSINEKEEE